ncbi:hypothetical protein HELRODRAFT_84287 [Helobdella robusta]|uniref:Uncharacterized protein n=1 Tax=Helobdella robusta TaxID=6412 RepID=T1G5H1_HELRO|nr:hypothetical protein HELRODRAFT_84287 [Helobdella robusta]ESN99577.1 hypothetical protein HELRODRAFT_84287 [Helobdella robusta]
MPEVVNILSEYFDVDYVCNSKLSSELAMETNDRAICEAVFKTGCDLNKHLNNATGDTLLIKAVSENHSPEMIELLLKYGADPDLGNDLNETAIHKASSLGLLEILRILVKHCHYLNRCDTKGQTALFKAVANGFCDVVKILVKAGTDLEWTDAEKRTPLICAVESNQVEVVKVLLEAGSSFILSYFR